MDKDFNRNNPINWKWGVFYVNSKDSRLIVPKRMKSLGWTLNFAQPRVWIGLALIALLLIVLETLIKS